MQACWRYWNDDSLDLRDSSALRRLEESSSDIHSRTISIEATLDEQTVQQTNAQLIEWLGLDEIRVQDNFDAALELRQPGTGSWFLEDVNFKEWQEKDGSFLWLHGIRESKNYPLLLLGNNFEQREAARPFSCKCL